MVLLVVSLMLFAYGCTGGDEVLILPKSDLVCDTVLSFDETTTYQTMEGFGASGAWWAQDVGGWDSINTCGIETREEIAELLFGESGIGLTTYRYNLGACIDAAADQSTYSHVWRQAESFLNQYGTLDFTKDANAVWMLKRAVELGVKDVVLFCNSAPQNLTVNGLTHSTAADIVNLAPEDYQAFADYCCDVAEYFLSIGIPVTEISPINEPQWEWTGGQEGCHYQLSEMIAIYKVVLAEMQSRDALNNVKMSMCESGNWKNDSWNGAIETTYQYIAGIMAAEGLGSYMTAFDAHSYGSGIIDKLAFSGYVKSNFENIKLRMTEWTEMESGRDATMSSGLVLAQTVFEDLNYLNVTSWQYWIAVSCYDYKDGLIYVDRSAKTYESAKRLYCLGILASLLMKAQLG